MASAEPGLTPGMLFAGSAMGLRLFSEVEKAVTALGGATVSVTKSEVAFRRRKGFAFVWRPGQYVRSEVPAVLSIALRREVTSDRIKSVAHPSATVWMHHIELNDPRDIDEQVREWLQEAYGGAG